MNDTTNIPRYTPSLPLQTVFVKNADGCGDQVFTQLNRNGNTFLYRRNRRDGKVHGYEVFVAKVVKAGAPLPGGGKVEADYEAYPGKSAFGRTAWALNRLEVAEDRFDRTVKTVANKAEVISAPQTVEVETVETDPVQPVIMDTDPVQPVIVETAPVAKVVKEKVVHIIPSGEFSRKQFAEVNGMPIPINSESYGAIKSLLAKGMIKETRRVSGGRGPAIALYVKV